MKILLLSVISGIIRILFSIIQIFIAIADSFIQKILNKNIVPLEENYYKHGMLNLFRGIVASVPLFGGALLTRRNNNKIRCCYENETSGPHTLRLFCQESNRENWLNWKSTIKTESSMKELDVLKDLAATISLGF